MNHISLKDNSNLKTFNRPISSIRLPLAIDVTNHKEQISDLFDLAKTKLGAIVFRNYDKEIFMNVIEDIFKEKIGQFKFGRAYITIFINKKNELQISSSEDISETGSTVYSIEQFCEMVELAQ